MKIFLRSKWFKFGLWAATFTLTLIFSATSSFGTELVVSRRVPASLVVDMLQATIAKCKAEGWNVSATIVDSSGVVQGLVRMDKAGPHTVDASQMKAFGAASFKRSTKILQKMTKPPEGGAWGLHKVKGALFSTGGLPLVVDGEVVGGIGVGGAPGGQKDETCAQAGIAVMKRALTR